MTKRGGLAEHILVAILLCMLFRPLSLQEANALVPFIKEKFERIEDLIVEGQLLQMLMDAKKKQMDSFSQEDTREGALEDISLLRGLELEPPVQLRDRFLQIEKEIRENIFEMQTLGACIKSIIPGRVDFLSSRHRQFIYLSWEMGESDIRHFRYLDENLGSRQVIAEPEAFGESLIH